MTDLKIGDIAPDFTLPADNNQEVSLSKFKGQHVVLFFYPKDDTPGCTKEACGFNDLLPQLKNLNATVIGISKCSVKKHDKFKAKYDLNFPLASDENGDVCETYGTWKEKSMYGKTYMGIERTTVLIDETGAITQIWRKVKVPGHVEDVQKTLEAQTQKAA